MKKILFIALLMISFGAYSQIIIGAGTQLSGRRLSDIVINPAIGFRDGNNEVIVGFDYYKDKLAEYGFYAVKYRRWFQVKANECYGIVGYSQSYDLIRGAYFELGIAKFYKSFGITPNINYFYSREIKKASLGIGIALPLK